MLSSTKLATKQQFWENTTCRQRFCFVDITMYYFENERINKPSKRLNCLRKARCQASAAACLTLSPPLFTWPVPMIHHVTRSWGLVETSLHLFPDHCFVDNCCRRDEIWPDMSTKKSVLDDSTSNFQEIQRDLAISWQLGVYMTILESSCHLLEGWTKNMKLSNICHTVTNENVKNLSHNPHSCDINPVIVT